MDADRRPATSGRLAIGLGVVALLGFLVFLLLRPEGDDAPDAAPSPERGTACSYLFQASEAFTEGDVPAFLARVDLAAAEAERALDRTGVRFGQPERLALELQSYSDNEPFPTARLEALLDRARSACGDRWRA